MRVGPVAQGDSIASDRFWVGTPERDGDRDLSAISRGTGSSFLIGEAYS